MLAVTRSVMAQLLALVSVAVVTFGCRPSDRASDAPPSGSTSPAEMASASASSGPSAAPPSSSAPQPAGQTNRTVAPHEPPPEDAPLGALRAFAWAHPDHPLSPRLRQVHDRRLLPCPYQRVRCNPTALIVAQGALDRASSYAADCLDCQQRAAVEQMETQLAAVVRDLETRRARKDFNRSISSDVVQAEQVLADAAGAYDNWHEQALKRLHQRRKRLDLPALEFDTQCQVPAGRVALVSPERPTASSLVRVVLASDSAVHGDWVLERADGTRVSWSAQHVAEGPPHWWKGERRQLPVGQYRAKLVQGGKSLACHRFQVVREASPRTDEGAGAWTSTRGWSREMENLYSVWLRFLLDAPEAKHWHGLFSLTRDPKRNLLHNHLGLSEDTPQGLASYELEPDCADGPYFLRAYFAWKLGLPMGWHDCRYGTNSGPPKCRQWTTNDTWEPEYLTSQDEDSRPAREERLVRMASFLHFLKEKVTARSLRTSLVDEHSDLYGVELTREALRPGVVFADPHGHTLTLVRWVRQQADHPGNLLSVDAQPDGTLAIKRFWRGNFVFTEQHGQGDHGFKAFRPIVLVSGEDHLLSNGEIAVARGYGHSSFEQRNLNAAGFYARIGHLINPTPLDPTIEYRALHEALRQQLVSRVQSVNIAEEYHAESRGKAVEMPKGRAIFRTTGPWEAYSTPCRDLRLLVGIDRLLAYPAEASAATPHQGRDPELEQRLRGLHSKWARELTIEYSRSDGSKQTLSLANIIARRTALEVAYNPNDCPEVRWAAPEGSDERGTCTRRAPQAQQKRMEAFRHWFEKRYACG